MHARGDPSVSLSEVRSVIPAYRYPSRRTARALAALGLSLFAAGTLTTAAVAPLAAQTVAQAGATVDGKKVLGIDDYAKWRSINGSSISADGKWVTYDLAFMNAAAAEARPVLHLVHLPDGQDTEVANATGGAFSPDGKWLAYLVDPSGGARGGRGGRGGGAQGGRGQNTPPPAPRRAELRNLATGAVQSWQDIQSFTFSANSSHLVLRRRAPGAAAANGAAAEGAGGAHGADVILHDLVSGHDQLLGSVGDISFNKTGDLLAYTVDAAPPDGNGLFVLDLKNDRINTLDNDARVYSRLTWND